MKLPQDIKNVRNVTWSHHAARGGLTYGLTYYHLYAYIRLYPYFIKECLNYVLADSRTPEWTMWRNEQDLNGFHDRLAVRCRNIPFIRHCYKKIRKSMDVYIAFADQLKQIDVWNAPVRTLAQKYKKYIVMIPRGTSAASTLIELAVAMGVQIERQLLKYNKKSTSVKNDMMVLGAPVHDTLPLAEELGFLRLVSSIGKVDVKKLTDRQRKLIERHFNAYRWMTVYFGGQPWAWEAFLQRIKAVLKHDQIKRLKILLRGHPHVRQQTAALIARYRLRSADIALFKELMFWRIQIENYYSLVNFNAMPLQQSLAQALSLSVQQLSFLLPDEVQQLIDGGVRQKILRLIEDRRKHYVMLIGKKQVHVYTGTAADRFMAALPKERLPKGRISAIRGVCGQPGIVRGRVRVVISIRDLDKVKPGEILVTMNTTPMYVPAMKKSAAIVTDEGGITCHAAIVARELGIPCVIGTKIATHALKTGDRVIVDAGSGMVKKVK